MNVGVGEKIVFWGGGVGCLKIWFSEQNIDYGNYF
jgi:hypothetical protein